MSNTNNNERRELRRPINYIITPLWKYTHIIQDSIDGGGNKMWTCTFCNKLVKSSYSKLKAHLLRVRGKGVGICEKVTDDIFEEIRREEDQAELNKLTATTQAEQKSMYVSLPPDSDLKQQKKKKR